MSSKEGTKRLTMHFYPGTKRSDLGTKRPASFQIFADLTMYWFPVCHFRCKEFKSLVVWKILLFLPYETDATCIASEAQSTLSNI